MNIQDLKSKFIEKYGEGEVEVFFSPGRVNLIGEHTDYNGGFVFPCALTFGTYCLVRRVERPSFRFASLNLPFETELNMDQLTTPLDDKWVNYPLGVLAQFVKKEIQFDGGADLMFYGNVPNGAGLSSSAALEVVTAVAINDVFQTGLDRVELVKMSQKAEHEFAGVHCGIMDQFASGMGSKGHAIFLNCDTLEYDLVPVKLEGAKIVISNTNSPHKLDSGKYNERVAECTAAVEAISKVKPIKNLGELSLEEFNSVADAIEDQVILNRARHVVSEIQRTSDAVAELKSGNIDVFGALMNASHDSLRDDYEVTGLQLDTMVEEARKIEGVIGSRMTGGGFGGCTVSIVKDDAVDTFIEEVGKNYEARTGIKPEFYVAEIGEGGCKLS
ncbi:galactokinase [Halosquirtibacter xylanolyticus]|uniref:galactokinase n=1 Tax=Halosquirtibacter xylanolyticus TaxID=3374599 RepID=UPI003749FFA2|nr:galactokinase [Prolixibacteraceae bacterium]